ncbi:uncharacterized protein LOC130430427 isoform X2 [Triplophysa dalaica]|uniref:uncharacterized protein LOC130430427 isoform X2 n=1 Tax=Triplophysa dalaica TaxID=1582913 RepID=UPI0024E02510|nr:uncharacterized protein LOC130430427 isoform X2 [Triplophysa dalaica]
MCLCCSGVFGDEVKSVSVMEGHSVTLHTDLTHIQTHDEIEWRFKDILIARIKRSVNINPIYNNDKTEIFRDRLKMNNQTGDLTITHITSQHSGLYHLQTIINNKLTKKNFSLNVNACTAVSISDSTQTPSSSSSLSSSSSSSERSAADVHSHYIIPLSCAVVAFLMVLTALLVFFICRKHRKTHKQDQACDDDEVNYAETTFYKRDTQIQRDKEKEEDVVYTPVNMRC